LKGEANMVKGKKSITRTIARRSDVSIGRGKVKQSEKGSRGSDILDVVQSPDPLSPPVGAMATPHPTPTIDFLIPNSIVSGADRVFQLDLKHLRDAEDFSEVCDSYVRNKVDKKTALTICECLESRLSDGRANKLLDELEEQGVPTDRRLAIVNRLMSTEVPPYRKYLEHIREIVLDIDAAKTILRLSDKVFSDDLFGKYSGFLLDLEKAFIDPAPKLVEQLDTLLQNGQRLLDSDNLSVVGAIKAALTFAREIISKSDERKAFLSTVRASIARQLNPVEIQHHGLTFDFIISEYDRFSGGKELDEDKAMAIYLLVVTMLSRDSGNSEFVDLLQKHSLRGYARLQGKVMEYHIALWKATGVGRSLDTK
jgi:hypothetical protein